MPQAEFEARRRWRALEGCGLFLANDRPVPSGMEMVYTGGFDPTGPIKQARFSKHGDRDYVNLTIQDPLNETCSIHGVNLSKRSVELIVRDLSDWLLFAWTGKDISTIVARTITRHRLSKCKAPPRRWP
jgi:hypothetical protein